MSSKKWSWVTAVVMVAVLVVSLAVGIWLDQRERQVEWLGAVEMMEVLPTDVGDFNYTDLGAYPEGWWNYSEWREHYGEEFLGQTWDKVQGMATCDDRHIWLWAGDFDLGQVIDYLGANSVESYDYGQTDVWKGEYYSTAVVNGIVITGYDDDVRRCIDASRGSQNALYDNEDYIGVLGRLPKAKSVGIWSPDYYADVVAMGEVRDESNGMSIETTVYKCRDAGAAAARVHETEMAIEKARQEGELVEDLVDFKITQDAEYVVYTIERSASSEG